MGFSNETFIFQSQDLMVRIVQPWQSMHFCSFSGFVVQFSWFYAQILSHTHIRIESSNNLFEQDKISLGFASAFVPFTFVQYIRCIVIFKIDHVALFSTVQAVPHSSSRQIYKCSVLTGRYFTTCPCRFKRYAANVV